MGGQVDVVNNRWTRPPGDFAIRIDASQLNANTWWRDKQLTVEHGTRALIFQAGVFHGEVPEGRYDMGGFVLKLNNFMVDQGMAAILVDAGDVTLDLEGGGLRSADGFELGLQLRLVLRVHDPDAMFVNLMKGRSVLRLSDPAGGDDLESQIADEAQMVLKSIAAAHSADELFASLELRSEFETTLRNHLLDTLSRFGLALVQLRFLDFHGERYAEFNRRRAELKIGEKEGEVELQQRRQKKQFEQAASRDDLSFAEGDADISANRVKLNVRLREVLSQEKLNEFKNKADFELFVRETEHALGLKNIVREDEMQQLRERFEFDRNRDGLLRRIEIEGITVKEKRQQALEQLHADENQRDERQRRDLQRRVELATSDVDRRKLEIELSKLEHAEEIRRAETELSLDRLKHDEQVRRSSIEQELQTKKAKSGMDMLRQVKELEAEEDRREQEIEEKKLASRSRASASALVSIMDGASPDKIIELERLRVQEQMSPEQMLGLAAQTSPEAAHALAARYQADGKISAARAELLESQLGEQRKASEREAERLERVMQTAFQQMGQVATTRAQAPDSRQTIVTPAVPGQGPMVISAGTSRVTAGCRFCGMAMEANEQFCSHCGKKQ